MWLFIPYFYILNHILDDYRQINHALILFNVDLKKLLACSSNEVNQKNLIQSIILHQRIIIIKIC